MKSHQELQHVKSIKMSKSYTFSVTPFLSVTVPVATVGNMI